MSPDKEAAWLRGCEIESVAFRLRKDPDCIFPDLVFGGENHGTTEKSLRAGKCLKLL